MKVLPTIYLNWNQRLLVGSDLNHGSVSFWESCSMFFQTPTATHRAMHYFFRLVAFVAL